MAKTTKKPNPSVDFVDADTGAIEWSGTLDDFLAHNRGAFSRDELRQINSLRTQRGEVRLGGGAQPLTILRRP